MVYTVTFYAIRRGIEEAVVTVQRVQRTALTAYTGAPAIVLRAARRAREGVQVDGFRIVDGEGQVMLDYADRSGGG